jgi:hypothetical protein
MYRLILLICLSVALATSAVQAVEEFRFLDISKSRSWILPINEPTALGSPVPQMVVSRAPIAPLQAPIEIHVWNSFEQGQFDSNRTRFVWNSQKNGFERRDTLAINTLEQSGFRNPADICHMLLRGATSQRIEHTAFSDMAATGYMPTEPAYEHFLESAQRLHYNQQIFLEAVSWMTAADVLTAFGGEIPWERISEIHGPHHYDRQALRDTVEKGTPGFSLCVRRAVLKLVAAQYWVGSSLFWGQLPWMTLPKLASLWPQQMRQAAMHFELSRAGQLQGDHREVEKLVSVAAAIANQWVRHASPDISTADVRVYVTALQGESRPKLFEARLGVMPVHEIDGITLLAGDLATLLSKRKPSSVLAVHKQLVNALSIPESHAIELVRHYRALATKELDFQWQGVSLNPMGGGILLRDYTGNLAPRFAATAGLNLDASQKALSVLSQIRPVHRPGNWRDARAVVDDFDWNALGIHPVLITNLNPSMAEDPQYVRKLLVAWASWGSSTDVDLDIAISVRSQDTPILEQLRESGMVERLTGKLFVWKASNLERYASRYPELLSIAVNSRPHPLSLGYWDRRSVLYDLPGL